MGVSRYLKLCIGTDRLKESRLDEQRRGTAVMNNVVRDARRVVLCDDHEIVRDAIKARMVNSNTVDIVGEASNGRDVVNVVKELEPDVLIIDVEMPKRDGIEATKEVLKVRPRTKVIIFTAHAQDR